ncbi:MAG TPA: trypsin-like peptidase domain-containing protein, partial [bacterium]|nr:trypsin-like peptidase domain-containing protein [bacterium]
TNGFDVMLLAFFTYLPINALEPAFGEYPRIGDKLMLVGYGHNALMMRVGPLTGYDDRGNMEIQGYASPGNSGGPVLIAGTRRVVGIGIETTVDRPQGASSFYCIVTSCGVKPPYVAAHIDRFLGVANFRTTASATTRP